ncbi:MAG TPA: GNAT family N-acetyltransferase [Anaerolineales bacterium]|nr:GNAT family N-acetyltransferase [Anaerolineales bacterium]
MIEQDFSLGDGVVTLRTPNQNDAPEIYQAVIESLAELKPWMSWVHDNYSIEETLEWLERSKANWADGSHYGFIITDARDSVILGGCGLSIISATYRIANLGYWVRTSRRGEGVAPRATLLLTKFAFEKLSLVRVEIAVAEGNHASLRAAEKTGALREGLLRNRIKIREKVHNAWMHSLIPEDLGREGLV